MKWNENLRNLDFSGKITEKIKLMQVLHNTATLKISPRPQKFSNIDYFMLTLYDDHSVSL